MKTSFLNDQQIRPIEYRKWAHAQRHFATRPKHRARVDELVQSIPKKGLRVPITLGVDDRHFDIYVADGHHRAIALMELGSDSFPFHWYWIRDWGVRMEREPFPFHLLER
ncbi:ParB N-terminal domain-containing protein [Streptomyces sp. ICBB 8177]|uniref:ParB N-terminal domain-containing protein n=1 Tax=Streptomyces sp. ICBB 8177 TaxID=563922 RepID=UPI0013051CBC|nr:ParB N-terminal domain-containing protein [Streptomyces sp. ICBB 8177]